MKLTAQTETERPGVVAVRAKAPNGRENDARPVCGFYVRRRYAGQEFMIAKWQDFSPRWMEFVDPTSVPEDWFEKIELREKQRDKVAAEAVIENAMTPMQRLVHEVFSMRDAATGGDEAGTLNFATGQVKKTSKAAQPKSEI